MNKRFAANTLALACALALPPLAQAEGFEFSGSGFLTVAAGKVVGGDAAADMNGYRTPLFIADYGQAGIYEKSKGVQFGPDSKVGLQGTAKFDSRWSVTGQLVARGADGGKLDVEWLYGSYKVTDDLTLQAGRKRLPLFYYSESQDVGLSMPWVRLPPQAYGWDIVNYDGVSLVHRGQLGGWTTATEVFFGNEKRKDNPYQKIYNGKDSHTAEKWSNIAGAAVSLSRDWLEARFSYIESKWEYWNDDGSTVYPRTKQRFYSAALVADYENWVVRTEVSYIDRKEAFEKDTASMIGVGYRFAKWLPMVTYAKFKGTYLDNDGSTFYVPGQDERHFNVAYSLRYDLTPSSAIKVQYDVWHDQNGPAFVTFGNAGGQGNARLLSISYDRVF